MAPKMKKTFKGKSKKRMVKKAIAAVNDRIFAKKVQAVISHNVEDKYITSFPLAWPGLAVYNGAPWAGQGTAVFQSPAIRNNGAVINIVPILPPIQQGTLGVPGVSNDLYSQADQRVGLRIKPKSLRVDFVVSMRGQNVNSNQLLVRMMCLSDKSIKKTPDLLFLSGGQYGTPVDSELFNYGNGTYGGFNGVPYDINWRVNRNRYTVHSDKILKLEKGYGQMPGPDNTVAYAGSVTTISPRQTHRYSVTLSPPEFLKYETDKALYPSNYAPFWACGFVQPDGDGTVDYLNQYIEVNYTTHLVYEDA